MDLPIKIIGFIISGPDQIHIKLVSGSKKEWREGREKRWGGSYNYIEVLNDRKVYKVSFLLKKCLKICRQFVIFENITKVFSAKRNPKVVTIIIFGTMMKKQDGN